MKKIDLTEGNITLNLFKFALPFMAGNLLQQFYNVADTLIVGRYVGENALAAVGSSYTLMVFITSILLGLCMGSGAYFSILYGRKQPDKLKNSIFISFMMIGFVSIVVNILVVLFMDPMLHFLQVPENVYTMMREYLMFIYIGIQATFLFNYFSNLLRSLGNSLTPLVFLVGSTLLNIVLDFIFVLVFHWGISGAAIATVLAQYVSGIGIFIFTWFSYKDLRPQRKHCVWNNSVLKEIFSLSFLTCVQQSIMNLGILMVQGLVNSFGTVIMAAFAAAVKIDSFAYMPVQDYGNAFSTFIAQNYGAQKKKRIQSGIRQSVLAVFLFSSLISLSVCIFAPQLMSLLVGTSNVEIIQAGVEYLRIEGCFYFGIGLLFMLYGYFRAVNKPMISVILTIASLGTRVVLAYLLSSFVGAWGIWVSVPIGWILADIIGILFYSGHKKTMDFSE